jgi:CheY-like chemotaxis protein
MLENAIKFTSTGYVEIRVSVLKQYDNLVDLRLSVIDTGIGVPETAQTRIFEDFRQADASTTRQYGGTGLGLAIVRRLADLMGGHVSVVSNAGGSEFIVSLTCEVSTPEISISPRALNAIVLKGSPSFMAYYQNLLACAGVATMAAESLEEINAILGSDALAHSKNKFILAERHSLAMNDTMLTNSLENLNIHVITCGYDTKTVSSKNNKSIICAETFFSYHELEEMMKSISFALWDTPREVKVKKSLSLEQPLSGKHALVVEDNKTNQDLICRMLKMFGTSCRTAWNGQEALDILETGDHFDFILMDCQMPVMDGYEATSVICQWKQCGKLTHIPVIGVTANVMHGDKARCFQAGMDYYLGKPVRKNLLLDTITAALIEQKMTCLV